jgi:hypothetical protein
MEVWDIAVAAIGRDSPQAVAWTAYQEAGMELAGVHASVAEGRSGDEQRTCGRWRSY